VSRPPMPIAAPPRGAAPLPVTCVSVSAALGGSERVLLEFAQRAPALGIAPTVLLPREGPLGEALRQAGVSVSVAHAPERLLALSQRGTALLSGAAQLARELWPWSRAIRDALPEDTRVLYSNGFKAHLACAAVRGIAARRVWHLHEFPPARIGLAWRLLAAALPDATLAVSNAVGSAWRLPGVTPPLVVPNGVDLDLFRPAPRTGWIHQALGLPPGARLIGMPAVFARWKGQLLVVEAFERAAAHLSDAHLVIVGGAIYDTVAEHGYAQELVRRVARAAAGGAGPALADRIHFLKFQPEPWRLYPEFEVVVHYSTRPEPFGRVVAESLACGTPVLAARAGGPLEILEEGASGWLVAPNQPSDLADAMVRALTADLGPMRAAARRNAETRCSADRQADSVASVLRWMAGGRDAPRG
jgi:glycosyltransferase involved in cell wall biosynthesis